MRVAFPFEKVRREKTDAVLVITLILLAGLGIAVLASASYFKSEKLTDGNSWYFFEKQLFSLSIGVIGAFLLARLSFQMLRKSVPILLLVNIVLMLLTLLPIWDFQQVLGTKRWIIKFGLSFQPIELTKLTVVLYLASMFDKKNHCLNEPLTSLLPPFIMSFFFVILTLLQNDYSSAMFLLFVILVLFFLAGVRLRYFLFVLAMGFILGMIGLFSVSYRMDRIISFLSPHLDPSGASYQITASLKALTAGGFWGKGFGDGTHKLGYIPEVHNDFIFASLAEEMGYLGVVVCVGLFCLLAYKGYTISLRQNEVFLRMIGVGITTFLVYQALINIAVVSAAIPATGITLPFFSYGGSSLFITLLMAGILVNLSRAKEASYHA